jgi:hypothetical protein
LFSSNFSKSFIFEKKTKETNETKNDNTNYLPQKQTNFNNNLRAGFQPIISF